MRYKQRVGVTPDRGAPPAVIRLVPSDRPQEELRELASPTVIGQDLSAEP